MTKVKYIMVLSNINIHFFSVAILTVNALRYE
jgi:hypothetical protein